MFRRQARNALGPLNGVIDGATAIVDPAALGAVSAVTGMVTGPLSSAMGGEPTPPDSPRYDKRSGRRERRAKRRSDKD